jgi:hypothetical protein
MRVMMLRTMIVLELFHEVPRHYKDQPRPLSNLFQAITLLSGALRLVIRMAVRLAVKLVGGLEINL